MTNDESRGNARLPSPEGKRGLAPKRSAGACPRFPAPPTERRLRNLEVAAGNPFPCLEPITVMTPNAPAQSETVLIVEDDPALLRGLTDNFEFEGYRVLTADDGEAGLEAAIDAGADLIVLDIMLPKVNGYEICRLVRREGIETPIILLTAKGQESDVVLGLNLGADDYVTKPFSIKELLARAGALLRRRRRGRQKVHHFGDCELNASARTLLRGGADVPLTPKEFGLLELLVRQAGRALTRDEILRTVWGYDVFVTTRSVDRCINSLRKKVEPDSARPTFIKTVREIGYRFEMPGE